MVYNNVTVPIARVEVDPINSDPAAIYALQVQIDNLYRQLYEQNLNSVERDRLLGRIRDVEASLSRLLGVGCGKGSDDYAQMLAERDTVRTQAIACQSQLQQLIAQQSEACQGRIYYDGRFRMCYWYVPTVFALSYWIYEYWYLGIFGFRFHLYDDDANIIMLAGLENYPTVEIAESEMFFLFERLISGELVMMPTEGEFGFSFHIGYDSDNIIAVCPRYFGAPDLRDMFMSEVWEKLMGIYIDGRFMILRRSAPVALSYWLYQYQYEDIFGYRFHIYDDGSNVIMLSGAENYPTMEAAESEMFFMFERLLSGELSMIPTYGELGYSFHIGYSIDHIIALYPRYFQTPDVRDFFMGQVWERLMSIYIGGTFALTRRWEEVIFSYWLYEYWYAGISATGSTSTMTIPTSSS